MDRTNNDHRVTAWDIETARRAYANAVLSGIGESIQHTRQWLEWLVAKAKEQR